MNREAMNAAVRARQASVREVGPLPPVADWGRRERCGESLLAFLETYFAATFYLAWSDDQREVVADVERVVRNGGLYALAMPRGSGKTNISVRAALWAILYGYRRFVILIAAESGLAKDLIEILKSQLQNNPLLLADFPELFPIHALQNQTKRQQGQTLDGVSTNIRLAKEEIVFPTITAASTKDKRLLVSSGAVIRAVGLTGSVRGQLAPTAGGETLRPDLALIDDAQNRESAKSPIQTKYREQLIQGDVLGLSGPGVKIACLSLCTVIYPDDLSERLLDKEKNPAWNGRRTQLLHRMPNNFDWWDRYADVRRQSLREHGDNRLGNALYAAERQKADAGAVSGWPARYEPDELSAVQFAMNIKVDRPEAFAAEYQNRPLVEDLAAVNDLTVAGLTAKTNRLKRGLIPRECTRLTAFIDVGRILWWGACGWDEQYGGSLAEWGTWPKQKRTHFTNADARQTIAAAFPGMSEASATWRALAALVEQLAGREWEQESTGAVMRIDRILIDSGWLSDTIHHFCRRSPFAALLLPSKGRAPGVAERSLDEWKLERRDRRGPGWVLAPPPGRAERLLQYDVNHFKTFVADRLLTPEVTSGSLWVNGKDAAEHEMLFDHFTCEFRTRVEVEKKGRTWDVWAKRPGRVDNHLWDVLVGCAVAASERGLRWNADGTPSKPRTPRPPATAPPRAGDRVRIKPTKLGA